MTNLLLWFLLTTICNILAFVAISSYIIKIHRQDVEQINNKIAGHSKELTKHASKISLLSDEINKLYRYKVLFYTDFWRGPDSWYSSEKFFSLKEARKFAELCDARNKRSIIIDLNTRKPIKGEENLKNWELYLEYAVNQRKEFN